MSWTNHLWRHAPALVLVCGLTACGGGNESGIADRDGAADGTASGGAGGTGGRPGTGGRDGGPGSGGVVTDGAAPETGSDAGNLDGGPEGGQDGSADAGEGGPQPPEPCAPDLSGPVPERPNAGAWQRVELPGAVCSNGSAYPIFVNYSDTSNNVVMIFEPGGACWDYESCSPTGGLRGAANPNGIQAGLAHMDLWSFLPVSRKDLPDNPMADWNMVFVPYCTGDIHIGNNTMTYTGPGDEELVYRHNGRDNVQRVAQWMSETFEDIPQLLVTGCSAGGAGSLLNYHFIRQDLGDAVQCSYLLSDSGPIFPSAGFSAPLHAKVQESWNTDPIIDSLDGQFPISAAEIKADLGLINTVLADAYPRDRLSVTLYRSDFNYSIYSYASFYGFPDHSGIRLMWESDITLLRSVYDTRSNLGYFIPYFRVDNCSHCLTLPPIGGIVLDPDKALNFPWLGTEIQESSVDLRDYLRHLLDDSQPLQSYFESDQESEALTQEEIAHCEGL